MLPPARPLLETCCSRYSTSASVALDVVIGSEAKCIRLHLCWWPANCLAKHLVAVAASHLLDITKHMTAQQIQQPCHGLALHITAGHGASW